MSTGDEQKKKPVAEAEATEVMKDLFGSDSGGTKKDNKRVKSIDNLESNIIGFEEGVGKLLSDQKEERDKIMEKRLQLKSDFRDLQKVEKVIGVIKREISDKIQLYQEHQTANEQKRMTILDDCKISRDEMDQMLEELECVIVERRQAFQDEMKQLEQQKQDLQIEAKNQAIILEASREQMLQNHLNKLETLEKSKIGAPPDELAEIEAMIHSQGQEFEENIRFMQRARHRRTYMIDTNGRYFLDEEGQKVYKEHSTASEYIANPDGVLEKVAEATDVLTDECGFYYLDSFGRKIYTKKFFQDTYGRYFLDKEGRRVYQSDNNASEYLLVDGEMVLIKEGTYQRDELGNRIGSSHSLEELITSRREYPCIFVKVPNLLCHCPSFPCRTGGLW